MKKFYDVEEKVPLLQAVPLSLQHLFAMFGSTVLVPFLLHVNPATALFMNGIGTILYLVICKGRLPAYLGSSFAFISPVLAVLATSGMSYGDAQGGFIAFGISFIILSFVVGKVGTSWIDVILPPAAMGAVVAVIGLELAPLALDMSGFVSNTMESQGIPNELAMITSVFTLGVAILASVVGRGFLSVIPVLIGVVAGYIMALCLGLVDLSAVENAPWVQMPTFYEPSFNPHAIMIIMPALFVVFAEHIGCYNFARRRRHHAESAYDKFARKYERHAAPCNYYRPAAQIERKYLRSSEKKYERGRHKHFICNGVEEFSQIGNKLVFACYFAVEKVG